MRIGNKEISGFAALAPMAGVADRAMREICVRFGAAFTVGELTSAKGITLNDKKSASLLTCSERERPFASQIFGSVPEIMADAARAAVRFSPDFIDIDSKNSLYYIFMKNFFKFITNCRNRKCNHGIAALRKLSNLI